MKQRFLALFLAIALCVTCLYGFGYEVKAEDINNDTEVNENYSAHKAVDALAGQAGAGTYGIYLLEGYSVINKISSTKVGAGGTTTAAIKCRVSTNAILERLVGGSWLRFNSWTTTVASGFFASVDKSETVDKGYYYRVRCVHRASTDSSSSYTSNLWM